MAEDVLANLEEQLICSICLDTYTDPKILQCFHVFCQQCVVPLAVRDQQGQLSVTCPSCRQVTPIPDRGVTGLQSAFHINSLLDIQHSLHRMKSPAIVEKEDPTSTSVKDAIRYCNSHVEEELKLYCETCEELICLKCAIKGGKHHSHDYEELNEAFEKYKEEIRPFIGPMEKQVAGIKKALKQVDRAYGKISGQQEVIEGNIHATFRKLREILDMRETDLIGQLRQMTTSKLKGLAAQKDQVETTLAKLQSRLNFVKESFKTNNKVNVLMMKTNLVKQIKELTAPLETDDLKPHSKANLAFSASPSVAVMLKEYGVLSAGLPDPAQCLVTRKTVKKAAVREKYTAILQVNDTEGKPCEEPVKSLECKLTSEISDTSAKCDVQRIGQSQYEITSQPRLKGKHLLHIQLEAQHVKGSPFHVMVMSKVEKLGTPIHSVPRINGPDGVTIHHSREEVVVIEEEGDCVSVFSPSGKKLRSFGTSGSGRGQLSEPGGVAVDHVGNILVADCANHRILKFTAEGLYLSAVGTKGSGPLQFDYPIGIAFNTYNNQVYVGDTHNHRVQVLNSDLTFSSCIGKEGRGKGQFLDPRGIACDRTGCVYVADSGSHCIQVFTCEGRFLRVFGKCGRNRGELDCPIGVAVDTNVLVYVSEANNHRVSVFTSKGQFVTVFGRKGEGPGEFKEPYGIAVDDAGVVYVSDGGNKRVQIF